MNIKKITMIIILLLSLTSCTKTEEVTNYEELFKEGYYYTRLANYIKGGEIIVKGEELSILDGMGIHKRSVGHVREEIFSETENLHLVYYIEEGEIEVDLNDYSEFGHIVNDSMQREDIMIGGVQTDTKFYPLYPKGEGGYNNPTLEMFYTENKNGETDGVKIISKVDSASDISYVEFTYDKKLDAFIGKCVYYNESPLGVYPVLY